MSVRWVEKVVGVGEGAWLAKLYSYGRVVVMWGGKEGERQDGF